MCAIYIHVGVFDYSNFVSKEKLTVCYTSKLRKTNIVKVSHSSDTGLGAKVVI